jgi:hypothetical protein
MKRSAIRGSTDEHREIAPDCASGYAAVMSREGISVIARSEATKQSIPSLRGEMDCFASLAMTAAK